MGGDASGIDAGVFGFFVLMALFVAGGLLGWSMLRHVRKVPPTFDPPPPRGGTAGDEEPPTARTPER